MKIKKKRWWAIGLILLLAVLMLGIGSIYLGSNKSLSPAPQNKKTMGSETIKPLQDGAKHKTNKRTYQVAKSDMNSDQYVASGNLTKPGQYSISPAGNRSELQQISENINQQFMDSGIKYTLSKMKLQLNQPQTDEALQMARMALNDRSIKGDYQTLIINYVITNQTDQIVKTDGLKEIELPSNHVVTAQSGLDNDAQLSQKIIQPGETVETFATILVGQSGEEVQELKQVTLSFAPVLDQNQKNITGDAKTLTVNF